MTTSFVAELEARGKAEGKAEGRIESILAILKARFDSVPEAVKSAVAACTDLAKLDALIPLAVTCESMEEFSKGLPQA
ncbi:hypothetical protein LJC22_02180 [Desulfosarcina sp. OttesenSCG-928-G10]|nr:hypothetical protein [Desulfosarcina sp. OttesenSCG-928-G10]MDL2321065.1 hypothetical protein [Desulfosarcina sp. OttesenSCG-928-B08]